MPHPSAAIERLITRAHREIDAGLLPSCQLAVARDGELVAFETLGDATADSRYAIFSCTKAIVASAMWMLLGDDLLRLADPVARYIPEFGTHGKDAINVEQLLLYTAGLPRAMLERPEWLDRDARRARYAQWRLEWTPGTRYEYHYTSAHWVMGDLIHAVTGMDCAAFVHARIMQPLGLRRFQLGVPEAEQRDVKRIVLAGEPATPAELMAAYGVPEIYAGEVNDAALAAYNEDTDALVAGVPGGGAVSTAADLAMFYQALLRNPAGLWHPAWLFDGTSNIRVTAPDLLMGGRAANRTLGLIVSGADGCGVNRGFGRTVGPRAFGHGGVGGQIAWADPDTGLSFSYLTNGRDRHLIREARRGVALSSLAGVCHAP